jgi:enoyl-CoA hydratase/carnithine racemase
MSDVTVTRDGLVAVVEMRRPPHNFFDHGLIAALADAFEDLAVDSQCRAIVLAAEGTSFCAGADFAGPPIDARVLYREALRLFAVPTPIVAAVHGAAIGGGLGLALAADFRVTCREARWSANFCRLGFHPGFALTVTLPELVGRQQAKRLLFTGARLSGEEATTIGLADVCVAPNEVRERAVAFAAEIAISAPLAVAAVKATLDRDRLDMLRGATDHELTEQARLLATDDAREGIAAYAERRPPKFTAT